MAGSGFEAATQRMQSTNNTAWDDESGELILPSHLRLELPTALFTSGFPTKMYRILITPMRVTYWYLSDQKLHINVTAARCTLQTEPYTPFCSDEKTRLCRSSVNCAEQVNARATSTFVTTLCCPWPVKHFILLARPRTWMSLTHHRHNQYKRFSSSSQPTSEAVALCVLSGHQ